MTGSGIRPRSVRKTGSKKSLFKAGHPAVKVLVLFVPLPVFGDFAMTTQVFLDRCLIARIDYKDTTGGHPRSLFGQCHKKGPKNRSSGPSAPIILPCR